MRQYKREKLRRNHRKMKGYDWATALGPVLILEKLSSAEESQVGRPENRCSGCFDSLHTLVSNTGF